MIVYRIVKADWNSDKCPCKGEMLIPPQYNIDNMPEGRKIAEEKLEEYRKEHFPQLNGRPDSIFVFPADKIEERAFHWAQKFVGSPIETYQIYLLELECDEPQWHNAVYYEDLCYLYSKKEKLMHTKYPVDVLMGNYWSIPEKLNTIEIEGLIRMAIIKSVSSCFVTHRSLKILEKDI